MDAEEYLTDGAILKDKNEKMEYIIYNNCKKNYKYCFFL
ncbi:MAG: hypothetical protein H6Q70_2768 [Firmicutes bacterium]|nr:hypothetical protein [Bacillota bacterium]